MADFGFGSLWAVCRGSLLFLALLWPAIIVGQQREVGKPTGNIGEVSSDEATHHLLSSIPRPRLPLKAIRNRITGTVCLTVIIAPSGDVEDVRAVSGPSLLWRPAEDAVRQWKYYSFLKDGQAQTVRSEVCVDFPSLERFPAKMTARTIFFLLIIFASVLSCLWAFKTTVFSLGRVRNKLRPFFAVSAVVGALLSASIYLVSEVLWISYYWAPSRSLIMLEATIFSFASAYTLIASAALYRPTAKLIVAGNSVLFGSLWILVGLSITSV